MTAPKPIPEAPAAKAFYIGATVRIDAPDIPEAHGKTGDIVEIDAAFSIVKVNIEGRRVALGMEDVHRVAACVAVGGAA